MSITRGMKSISATPKKEASPPPPPPTPPQSHITSISDADNNQQQTQISQPDPNLESGSDYEHFREQRIKENRQRLEKLGIVDISLKLKSLAPSRRTPRQQSERKTPLKSTLPTSEPIRRSSRLQNVTPVTYTEQKEDKSKRNQDILLEEGSKPEFYTEEHEKLLGSTEMPWTFFVDGYRQDGTRIYDPVNGKTCHQCRQKTLGLRTHCCQCNLVQGQFCGDCLYMRYGEHVLEANQNPEWKCPACRGICNCSLCRHAKGWPATGSLYRKISSLGFKSVAHYLITTKRAPPNLENKCTEIVLYAKRALPFDGMEVPGDEETQITENEPKLSSESVGRSRKMTKKEDVGAEEEKTNKKIDEIVEDTLTSNVGSNARRVRPTTKLAPPNLENKCTEIVLSTKGALPFSGMEVLGGEETQITKNEPKPSSKSVGRPRKRTKRENVGDEEDKANKKIDENVEDAPTSNAGSNARRLRPRTKA